MVRSATRITGAVLVLCSYPVVGLPARADTSTLAFSGSAAAEGVLAVLHTPKAPFTDTLVNGGGPTAQVAVDSLGSSSGYAAFPDPGDVVLTLPPTLAGALGLPSPPSYPLYVHSDTNTPEQSIGHGPYELSAKSDRTSSEAAALAGFRTEAVGNIALSTANASLKSSDTAVVATATSRVQGLAVGPLTMGEIVSTATVAMDASGMITPSTSLQINGMTVGGVPVAVTPQGLAAGGSTIPLPINETLGDLLNGAGITIEVVKAQQFSDRAVSPAVRITMPLGEVGGTSPTTTLIVGWATASLTGSVSQASIIEPPTTSGSASVGGATAETTATLASIGGLAPPSSSTPLIAQPAPTAPSPAVAGVRASDIRTGLWDIRSFYLMVVTGGVVALVIGQLVGLLGVRRP